jgi:ribonuclease-3
LKIASEAAVTALEDGIGYRFADKALALTALTHPSYGENHRAESYQRLEFLGDAVLELAVSRHLYLHQRDMDEGRLSRRRAALVCEEALCEIARGYDLGALMRFSRGEEKTGGRERPSILADVFEAVLAAVYLDGGTDAAVALVERAYADLFRRDRGALDAKTALQEIFQARGEGSPTYETVGRSGPDHAPVFAVRVLLGGEELARGEGRSKQAAQQTAARAALDKINE